MVALDLHDKIDMLVGAACYEATHPTTSVRVSRRGPHRGEDEPSPPDLSGAIYQAAAGGRRVPLLKVLLTNVCENDCRYCGIRASHSGHRISLEPDQLACAFDDMRRRGLVSGLFLSSGLCGNATRTMDRLLDTVAIVRDRYEFDGYVHLKILPGARTDQVEQAGRIANRVSVNLEAPSRQRLAAIAPAKDFDRLVGLVDKMHALGAGSAGFAPSGQTTQFVAGGAGESDSELLGSAGVLYSRYGLRRVYYSGFRPVRGTPLEDVPPMARWREFRLYQGDALLREYGFEATELPFQNGALPEEHDPKLAWALLHPEAFPVEINRAGRQQLLRVPGFGPTAAERLLRARRSVRFRDLVQLSKLGIVTGRCAPFVLLDGRRPAHQLALPLAPG